MSATASTATQPKPLEWLNRLRANPRIPLIVAGSAAVAIVVAMVLWAKTPDYRTLFSNLSDQDGGAIVAQLTQMNIPYRFANGSGAIEVPADKVHELRLRLAQQGLPKGGAVGFELLDQEKFGISQFSEQVNYQRALEGELARTIETLGPVKSARVHLAMPKPSLFVREQKSPSASVTVTLEPGRALDEGQISAVVHLVSSAVAGLPPGNVTLVDQSGHLLTQSNTSGRDLNDAQLKFANDVESRIQRRIEAILSPIVGNGNVHAQVTAQLDFANKEQTEEHYSPNGDASKATLRSRQLNISEQVGAFMTSLYTFRMIFIVFHGKEQIHAHAGKGITHHLPLIVLMILSTFVGALIVPPLQGVLPQTTELAHGRVMTLEITSGVVAIAGILIAAWLWLGKRTLVTSIANSAPGRLLGTWWYNAWGFDWLYDKVFVKPFLGIAWLLKRDPLNALMNIPAILSRFAGKGLVLSENGYLRWYVASMSIGAVVVLALLMALR